MKLLVMNFSGNVGKSTISRHLLFPRLENAEYIAVESINADGSNETAIQIRGSHYETLMNALVVCDNAVIDVGASNIEPFIKHMSSNEGSYDDIDYFIIPTVAESKQQRDTVTTIKSLINMGVSPSRIRVIMNKVEYVEDVSTDFKELLAYLDERSDIHYSTQHVVTNNDVYQMMLDDGDTSLNIERLSQDTTDYKAQAKAAANESDRSYAVRRLMMTRLAKTARKNLDAAYSELKLEAA